MSNIFKICVLMCLHKSDFIKLMPFSTKNLLVVNNVTLVKKKQLFSENNIFRKYFSYRCLKYLLFECSFMKGNILSYPFPQFRKCSSHRLYKLEHYLKPLFPLPHSFQCFVVTCKVNGHIY